MSRLRKLTTAAAAAALFTATIPVSANAETIVLKLASFVPPVNILHKPIFEQLAADMKAATGGKVEIKVYPSGQLGKGPVDQYKRAVNRIAEISFGLPGYTSSVFPRTLLIELPGMSNSSEDATRKLWKVMDSHLRAEFKRTVPLALFVTPPSVLMMRSKPVRTLKDLAGLKIRVASATAAAVVEAYGATPVPMPANKVYTAMSTGVVDGALMGSDSLLVFKLIETTKYVTVNLPEMPTALFLVANAKAFNELNASQRKALTELTGLKMSLKAAALLDKFGKIALDKFKSKPGAEIITLSAKERAAFAARADAAVKKLVKGADAKGVSASDVIAAMKK